LERSDFYDFGPFRLDTKERVLLRDGSPISLTPKAFETLMALVERSGHVLEKEELMKRIWPDSFVEDANLAVNISSLRKILGERPDGSQYIETVPRRGYRFIGEVKESLQSQPEVIIREHTRASIVVEQEVITEDGHRPAFTDIQQRTASALMQVTGPDQLLPSLKPAGEISPVSVRPAPYRWIAIAIALLVVFGAAVFVILMLARSSRDSTKPRTLAILPFRNLKPDVETDFLGFSLADAVITKLGYVSALIVRPSSYVDKYRNQIIDPKMVASELNVNTLLTGTFLKEGDDLRITAQLIDLTNDQILWKHPMDLKYDRLLTVQDQVARQIINGLQLNLTSNEAELVGRDAPDNPKAYELFLRGVDHYQANRFTTAVKLLEQSIELNPGYAPGWAHLGRARAANAAFQLGGQADYKKAQMCYERALVLNPEQIEAHIYMANLFTDTGRAAEAVPLLREVLDTNPNLAEAHWELGYAYRFGGLLEESIRECELARQLDPEVKIYSSAMNSYLYHGDYQKFLDSLPISDVAFIVFYRGLAHYYLKNYQQSATYFDRAFELDENFYTRIGKALSLGLAGKKNEGLVLLREMRQMIDARGVRDAEGIYKVAQAYAALGDRASALLMLRHAIEGSFICYPYFISDPLLEGVRGVPEYATLMELASRRHEEFKRNLFPQSGDR
jgi:DNA-binding winged helix-turn-helix (wHTH) protein/TolB-like protein